MTALYKRFATSLAVLLAALTLTYGRPKPHYTFILPDGYVGWVQIVFNDPQAPPLQVKRDGGRVIEVPESGILRTSDILVRDSKSHDEFLYRLSISAPQKHLRPLPVNYVINDLSHGGFDVMDTGGRGPGNSWFIFFGPPEIRARTPMADISRTAGYGRKMMAPDVYPTPGRLSPVATQTNK
jgi:hypothetical protein